MVSLDLTPTSHTMICHPGSTAEPIQRSPGLCSTLIVLMSFAALFALSGCAGLSSKVGRDGPPTQVPPGLERTPNAVPRLEPIRVGGPNKPYEAAGQLVVPLTRDQPLREEGLASWYGTKYHGRATSSGETYDMFAMTAAHRTMPIPSYARVKNPANGREVVVRINDRGPFVFNRIIDLSYTAALKLGVLAGVAPVVVERITFDEIRQGRPRAQVWGWDSGWESVWASVWESDLATLSELADLPQRPPLTLSTAPVQ
mgnify:FL=1